MKKGKSVRVPLEISADAFKKLRKMAKADGKSRSQWIQDAIIDSELSTRVPR